MARKPKITIYKTYPTRTAMGDGEYWFGKEPHAVTPLPKDLQEPLPVNSEAYFEQYLSAAGHHQVSLIEFEANFKAEMHSRLASRWNALLEAYEVKDDSKEAWRHLAFDIARDYIPGLSVAYVSPAKSAPRVMNREHIEALVNHVRKVMDEMKVGRSSRAPKVTESQALKAVWKNWPPELGRKRSTLKSFEVHYYQCKAAFAPRMDLASLGLGNYKSA